MKSNSLLTYLLYALLATLIVSALYKACQMQKEKQLKAKEEAEWQETLKKLYPEGDSTGGGSAYINTDSATQTSASRSVPSSGIEDSRPAPATSKNTTTTKPSATTTKPATSSTATTAAPTSTTKPPAKGSTAVQGVGAGKWEVRAGTFSMMEGARTRLEEVIKMGYTNAEIRKTSNGKAAVIVLRTNDKTKATQAADQLAKRGVDAAVFKN